MKGNSEMLCAVSDISQAQALSQHANVACRRCGAQADNAANVCDPVRLSNAG